MKRTRFLLAVGCASVVPFGLIACGDSKDKPAATATTGAAQAPEAVFAPDAKVATGLTNLKQVAVDISKQTDATASKKASEGLEPIWSKVEGTVKRNEPDMYATVEENLSLLESGDAKKTRAGSDDMGRTVDAYVAKHPG